MTTPRFSPDAEPVPPTAREEVRLELDCAKDLIERLERVLDDPGHSFEFEMLPEHEHLAVRAESARLYSVSIVLWCRLLTALAVEPSETDC